MPFCTKRISFKFFHAIKLEHNCAKQKLLVISKQLEFLGRSHLNWILYCKFSSWQVFLVSKLFLYNSSKFQLKCIFWHYYFGFFFIFMCHACHLHWKQPIFSIMKQFPQNLRTGNSMSSVSLVFKFKANWTVVFVTSFRQISEISSIIPKSSKE